MPIKGEGEDVNKSTSHITCVFTSLRVNIELFLLLQLIVHHFTRSNNLLRSITHKQLVSFVFFLTLSDITSIETDNYFGLNNHFKFCGKTQFLRIFQL